MKLNDHLSIACVACIGWITPAAAQPDSRALSVAITVDSAKKLGELRPGDVFVRAHNLLCSGDGTPALKWGSTGIYAEDQSGNPIYNWTIIDRIFDAYRARGVRPYVENGFMPEALSTHPEPYQHEWRPGADYRSLGTGWSYPPKDCRPPLRNSPPAGLSDSACLFGD